MFWKGKTDECSGGESQRNGFQIDSHQKMLYGVGMQTEEISWLCGVFRTIELFTSLTVAEVSELIERMEKYQYEKGRKIVRQGEKGESFFIIYKGKVKALIKKGLFGSMQVGELGPGQFFGEMALLSKEPRSATIQAAEDTQC